MPKHLPGEPGFGAKKGQKSKNSKKVNIAGKNGKGNLRPIRQISIKKK